jgi:hypothetical protein
MVPGTETTMRKTTRTAITELRELVCWLEACGARRRAAQARRALTALLRLAMTETRSRA